MEATKPLSLGAPDMLHSRRSIASVSHRNIGGDMADDMQKDWRDLCVAVTNESDPTKLSSLVQELIEALDQGERSWRYIPCPPDVLGMNQEAA